MADDSDFFLHAVSQANDLEFREDERRGVILTPLVDAQETFTAMEETVKAAHTSIHMAFWFFNPATPLLTGPGTWAKLLADKVKQKDKLVVRIILSNLDPFLQKFYHQEAWKAYSLLQKEAESLSSADRKRFQVICSFHPATLEKAAEQLLTGKMDTGSKSQVETVLEELNKIKDIKLKKKEFSTLPGLWENITLNEKKKRFEVAKKPNWIIYPGSHHQKILIVDKEVAFCGGMDINPRRFDNSKHEPTKIDPDVKPPKLPWHDVDCRVEGEIVSDIDRNFLGRWNAEIGEAKKFIENVNKVNKSFRMTPIDAEEYRSEIEPPKAPSPPKIGKGQTPVTAQVHRTISVNNTAVLAKTAQATKRADIKQSYERAIKAAESFIYIESQYVRSTDLGDWLLAKAKTEDKTDSAVQIILVVPVAPEEYSGTQTDPLTLHGMFLQSSLIIDLKAAFKERFGVYSMVKAKGAGKADRSNQIYVHSKILIVDDRFASIGSANANARSFELDTEIAVGYVGAPARDLRIKLWTELLGSKEVADWKPAEFVTNWNAIATKNSKPKKKAKRPEQKKQTPVFIVPHDPIPGKEYQGRPGIPEEFTQYFDPKTNPPDETAFA